MSNAEPCIAEFQLPETLPVFPLRGALLLPRGQLPLHIFEERFLSMFHDALKGDRIIGMIQPRADVNVGDKDTPLFDVGCAGRITAFEEMPDSRYLVTLTGLCRFSVLAESGNDLAYRMVTPDWSAFLSDLDPPLDASLDRSRLKFLLHDYFILNDIACNGDVIDEAPDDKIMTCLPMICPFDPCEKQALLEAPTYADRADLLFTMLDMAVQKSKCCGGGCH